MYTDQKKIPIKITISLIAITGSQLFSCCQDNGDSADAIYEKHSSSIYVHKNIYMDYIYLMPRISDIVVGGKKINKGISSYGSHKSIVFFGDSYQIIFEHVKSQFKISVCSKHGVKDADHFLTNITHVLDQARASLSVEELYCTNNSKETISNSPPLIKPQLPPLQKPNK